MMHIIDRTFAAIAALMVFVLSSCTKEADDREVWLDVNASNLHGAWELTAINGQPLEEGTYVHITFDRSGNKFEIKENHTSIPSSYNHSEGTFAIYIDPELGAYIRGVDLVKEEWRDTYLIKDLTRDSMIWYGMKDPTFIQEFRRIESVQE